MAVKKYIIKQTTNWNGKGIKTGTHTVTMAEAEVSQYVLFLDGKVEVYEQNVALSVEASGVTSSLDVVDLIKIRHSVLKPIYISNTNKRPIVFKTSPTNVMSFLAGIKPFDAPYSADLPYDVSIDTGTLALL